MEDLEAFARLLTALRPWLRQLVVVGGWAHRLHRLHGLAKSLNHLPLRTRDTDLAFSPDETLSGDVREALAAAGFTEEFLGDDTPPATHYRLGDEAAGFYAEFLTPLVGSEMKRGKRDATVLNAGITAQRVRYLDILLIEPWSVRVGPEREVPLETDTDLFVPNPTSFVVQKLLIHSNRPAGKKAQDVLYIHDTLELFGASLGDLRRLWSEDVRLERPFTQPSPTVRPGAKPPSSHAHRAQLCPLQVRPGARHGPPAANGEDRPSSALAL